MLTVGSTNTKKMCSAEFSSYIRDSIKRSLEYKITTKNDELVVNEIRKQIQLEKERERQEEEREKQEEEKQKQENDPHSVSNVIESNKNPESNGNSYSYIKWITIIGITCLLTYKTRSLAK